MDASSAQTERTVDPRRGEGREGGQRKGARTVSEGVVSFLLRFSRPEGRKG